MPNILLRLRSSNPYIHSILHITILFMTVIVGGCTKESASTPTESTSTPTTDEKPGDTKKQTHKSLPHNDPSPVVARDNNENKDGAKEVESNNSRSEKEDSEFEEDDDYEEEEDDDYEFDEEDKEYIKIDAQNSLNTQVANVVGFFKGKCRSSTNDLVKNKRIHHRLNKKKIKLEK